MCVQANTSGWVVGGVDWLGMSSEDKLSCALMVETDLSNFPMIPDRLHQGDNTGDRHAIVTEINAMMQRQVINLVSRAFLTWRCSPVGTGMVNALLFNKLMADASFIRDDAMTFNGRTVVDPTRRFFYGGSLGGILGSVYMRLRKRCFEVFGWHTLLRRVFCFLFRSVTQDVHQGVLGKFILFLPTQSHCIEMACFFSLPVLSFFLLLLLFSLFWISGSRRSRRTVWSAASSVCCLCAFLRPDEGANVFLMPLPAAAFLTLVLQIRYHSAMDRMLLMSEIQMLWDRLSPSGWLNHLTRLLPPNTPQHAVLVQVRFCSLIFSLSLPLLFRALP